MHKRLHDVAMASPAFCLHHEDLRQEDICNDSAVAEIVGETNHLFAAKNVLYWDKPPEVYNVILGTKQKTEHNLNNKIRFRINEMHRCQNLP